MVGPRAKDFHDVDESPAEPTFSNSIMSKKTQSPDVFYSLPTTPSGSIILSAAEDDNAVEDFDKNDHSSTSHDLCHVCRYVDFEYIGFHDSSTYSSNNYSFRREFPTLLNNSDNCPFCEKLVSIITDWLSDNAGDRTKDLDVSRSLVDVGLETDWHTVMPEEGEEGRSDGKAHSDRVRISYTIPGNQTGGETGQSKPLTFFLQRYENLSHAFHRHLDRFSSRGNRPYDGRTRPTVVDLALFKSWKQLCQELHGTKCSQIFQGTPKIRPRVIDIEKRCLTFAKEDDGWVCLSYVWGKASTFQLTKANAQALSMLGSLTSNILPNIIEDALQVTKGLGERYLWVDSLCIIQDDDQDKAEFISQMDSIYTWATVVIISSTCVNANSPIPGVQSGSRSRKQEPFKIRDVNLVQSLDPVFGVGVDLRTGRAAGYLGETIWDTRAWTLQERFLASRSLVFTAEQVFWECEEAFWCEDSYREVPNVSPDPHRTSLCEGELNLSWNSDIPTFDHYYRVLLKEYSGRALTFDKDGLNAFGGIIRAFEMSMGESFFWGMPTSYLESALAWGHQSHKLRRRDGIQPSGSNTSSQDKNKFPSWSWVGWTSDGQTKLSNQNLTMQTLGLKFYRVSDDGKAMVELKQAGKFNCEVDLLVDGSTLPNRSSRTSEISVSDLPTDPPINLSSAICFWTVSTRLDVTSYPGEGFISSSADPSTLEIALSQRPGNSIQVSWSHMPPSLKQGDKVELIAVAQNRGNWGHGHIANGAIGVMVISWDTSGLIAAREGFAWITIRDWTLLSDRTSKLIILG